MSLDKTRVWVRTTVLNEAAKVGKKDGGDKDWAWARATLLSGNVEQASLPEDQRSPVKVLVQDEDSPLNSTVVEIPASLVVPKKRSKLPARSGGGKVMAGSTKTSSDPPIVFANHCESAELDDKDDGADDGVVGVVALLPPDDLIHLTHLHEASVTYSIRRRYQRDIIYTYTGPILLALNPFKALPQLYSDESMESYFRRGESMNGIAKNSVSEGAEGDKKEDLLPPHIYGIADGAFRSMMAGIEPMGMASSSIKDQAILVSGESGAGKTVTAKHIMSYLSTISKRRGLLKKNSAKLSKPSGIKHRVTSVSTPARASMSASGVLRRSTFNRRESWTKGAVVEEKVLESNPILESFGNARTVRNDNSSRFGKFIELQFKSTGSLIGAAIETYLLEKIRLVHQSPGERNYHIFYELLAGATEEERERYYLKDYTAKDFKMTSGSGTFDRRDGVDDEDTMDLLFNAMRTMGFDQKEMQNIFGVAVACLHLSNVVFSAISADECKVEDSYGHLESVLRLLGFQRDDFNTALCYFTIMAGKEKHSRSLSKAKAEKGLEALIKATYSGLFDYLVKYINDKITFKGAGGKAAYIGVLDIFGFEVFEKNSFEQLCINYCNEALQQQFNKVVFSTEQAEYEREGIEWSFIEFPDNKEVLSLIEHKGTGIIPILNDMCLAPGLTDLNFARDLYKRVVNPRFEANALQMGKGQFVVHHYALSVTYDTEGFVEKNKDEIPKEAKELLESSSNSLVRKLAKIISPPAPEAKAAAGPVRRFGGKKKSRTVGGQFVHQLKKLRKRIDETNPHYIRCLKPNQHLGPNDFNPGLVSEQLRSLGVVEAVKLSRTGFPQRYRHDRFVHRYGIIGADEIEGEEGADRVAALVKVLARKVQNAENSVDENGLSDEEKQELSNSIDPRSIGIQIGKTKIFLQQEAFDELEGLRIEYYDVAAIKIQTQVRGRLGRKLGERLRREAEERARREAEERARREAEEKARREREAAEKARREAEEKEKKEREALERAQREAEARAVEEAEEAAKKAAQEEAWRIAKEKAKLEFEQKAKKKALEERRKAEEETAKREAEEKEEKAKAAEASRRIAEEKAQRLAEEKAKKEAEDKAQREAEKKAQEEAEQQAKKEAEEKSPDTDDSSSDDSDDETVGTVTSVSTNRLLKNFSSRGFMARKSGVASSQTTFRSVFALKSPFKQSAKFKQSKKKTRTSADAYSKPVFEGVAAMEGITEDSPSSLAASFSAPRPGEYDVVLPLTSIGFMINVGEIHGSVAFVGYRDFPDGSIGPAEEAQMIKSTGDKIIAINGATVRYLSFREVVDKLGESKPKGKVHIRFQESQYAFPGMRIEEFSPPGE